MAAIRLAVGVALLVLAGGCGQAGIDQGVPEAEIARLEAVAGEERWWRGNLHTHDLWSDGDDFAESVASRYREAGYHFLALTNHDSVMAGERWLELARSPGGEVALQRRQEAFPEHPIEVRPGVLGPRVRLLSFAEVASLLEVPGEFMLMPGVEVSDSFEGMAIHLNALNTPDLVLPGGGPDPVAVIERNLAAYRALSESASTPIALQLNHPNFGRSLTPEQIMRVSDLRLMEVFNGHPISRDNGDALRPDMELVWDRVLTHRIVSLDLPLVYGTATDDAHHFLGLPNGGARPDRGWVQVLAASLDRAAVVEAMLGGRFYASTGVALERVVSSPKGVRVEVAGEPGVDYTIEFIGTRTGFDPDTHAAVDRFGRPVYASRVYDPAIGAVLSRVDARVAEYRFDEGDLYVRARVTASERHPDPSRPLEYQRAWTQPVEGPAAALARERASAGQAPPLPDVALHRDAIPRFRLLDRNRPIDYGRVDTCGIDVVRRGDNRAGAIVPEGSSVYVGGWIADASHDRPPDSIGLLLEGGETYFAEGPNGSARPDVARALQQPRLEGVGFDITARLDGVAAGEYALGLIAFYPSGAVRCSRDGLVSIAEVAH